MKMKKRRAWFLFLFWLLLIFFFSHQNGSTSSNLSNSVLNWFSFLGNVHTYQFVIRKLAHFTEYFILAILTMNLLRYYPAISKRHFIAILICLLYAISDEFHQTFIAGRTPKMMDVMIDTFGAIVGVIIFYFIQVKSKKKHRSSKTE